MPAWSKQDPLMRSYLAANAEFRFGREDAAAISRTLARIARLWEPQIGAFVATDSAGGAGAADRRASAGAPASRCRRSTACRSASRTFSRPSTCRPRWARRCLPAGARKRMPPACAPCARPARVIIGKTVTTEFAAFEPRGTRNPWNTAHTPGGSSSGSAAAVGAGLVSAALGTQVIGSTIRPASFCGCVGFKPSVNALNREGSHDYQSQSCTGVLGARWRTFGRSRTKSSPVSAAMPARPACAGRTPLPPAQRPRRLAVLETAGWDGASVAAKQQLGEAIMRLQVGRRRNPHAAERRQSRGAGDRSAQCRRTVAPLQRLGDALVFCIRCATATPPN